MPPVGMTDTKLPVFRRDNGPDLGFERALNARWNTPQAPLCQMELPQAANGINHNAIARCLMPVDEVPTWMSVHGDYVCDGVSSDADVKNCQRIGIL